MREVILAAEAHQLGLSFNIMKQDQGLELNTATFGTEVIEESFRGTQLITFQPRCQGPIIRRSPAHSAKVRKASFSDA